MARKKSRKRTDERREEKLWYQQRREGFFLYAALWKILRTVLIYLSALIIVIGLVYTGGSRLRDYFLAPMDAKDSSDVKLSIASGSSLTSVARQLEKDGLIRNGTVFKYYADLRGMGGRIQSGDYLFNRSQSADEILGLLVSGDGLPKTMRITVIPGWTVEDVAEYLTKTGLFSGTAKFLEECKAPEIFGEYYFVQALEQDGKNSLRKYPLEGYLSPNTYEIYTSSDEEAVLRKLLSQMDSTYISAYEERAQTYGFSMNDVLTLASVIEKEAKREDFARVSAVFHNRLSRKMTLDSDATVKYVSGSKKMSLNAEDISIASPYNTYKNKGLPPGPICNPSADAIVAALYPDETYEKEGFLYFCSMDPDSGALHFSKTLEEHEAAVALYRPLWEAYDQSRGVQ